MKLNLFFLYALVFWGTNCFSQISVTSIEKKEVAKKNIPTPLYDSLESFVSYGSYYRTNWQVPKDEKCSIEDFYKRYINLQIYYPLYSNEFRKKETIIFSNSSPIKYLNWEEIGDKYYTIINIYPSFDKTKYFDRIKQDKNISLGLSGSLLFELKNEKTDEVIFSVESDYSNRFVLVPYFLKRQQMLRNKTLVTTEYISARKFPDVNEFLRVEEKTEWKGEFTIIRNETLSKYNNPDTDEQIILVYILKSNENSFILFNDSQHGNPVFSNVVMFKEEMQKLESKSKAEEELRVNAFVKKYGAEYGKLIARNKIKLGMSKEMCQDAWGVTFDIKKITDNTGEKEMWKYVGKGRLVFINGVLTSIIE